MKTKLLLSKYRDYPLKDGHRLIYVLHPVRVRKSFVSALNGKKSQRWGFMAAEVLLPEGFIKPNTNPAKVFFDNEADCQTACNKHNTWAGWSADQANEIISLSMENSVNNSTAFQHQ